MRQSRPEPPLLYWSARGLPRRPGRAAAAGDRHKQQRGVRSSRWHARARGTKAWCGLGLDPDRHDNVHMSPRAGRGGASCRPPAVCMFSWDSLLTRRLAQRLSRSAFNSVVLPTSNTKRFGSVSGLSWIPLTISFFNEPILSFC